MAGRERLTTPKGQMAGAANQKPALQDLPPHLRVMFEPRSLLEYKAPIAKRPMPSYTGISQYTSFFETTAPPPATHIETLEERQNRIKATKVEAHRARLEARAADYDPMANSKCTEDAFRTLFIGRLSYDTTEKKLKREFEQFGPISGVKLISDKDGKSRGYAFVCFEREEDLTIAYKRSDGKKIDGRRILVDVERGRTVKNWRPARLGGGLGGREPMKSKKKLREEAEQEAMALKKTREGQIYGPSGRGGSTGGGVGSSSFSTGSSYRPVVRGRDSRERDGGRGSTRERGGDGGGDRYRPRSRSRDRNDRDPSRYDRGGHSDRDRSSNRGGWGGGDRGNSGGSDSGSRYVDNRSSGRGGNDRDYYRSGGRY